MAKVIRTYKGGSLSATCLMRNEDGKLFVRKSVSLIENREYGFQRWYSQLKRLQRYSALFPGLFPRVIRFGKDNEIAYFDIEYFESAINAQEYIEQCQQDSEVDEFFISLINIMSILHKTEIPSNAESMELYLNEEIEQRLKDCSKNKAFIDFLKYEEILFNGTKAKPFLSVLDEYKILCKQCYVSPTETFTHGNITLENMLYVVGEKRIILIDPYEENIIDSVLAEYSQLLQSTNSKYEMYNCRNATVVDNKIVLTLPKSFGIEYLNEKILQHIRNTYSQNDYIVVRLLEISQFIRMLPFKMAVDESKMIFFYGLASYLFELLREEYIALGGSEI
ncbi:MAG: hypothetical protein GY702_02470 [Desulfobulbaceae bacterium]|nr:hypothetical protein [Desulfobulbaceae bacterium]